MYSRLHVETLRRPVVFGRAYDILVAHAGAQPKGRGAFLQAFVGGDCVEYRFMGDLGFGGKFWRNDGRLYVTCYREDETPERRQIIERVNDLLGAVLSLHPTPTVGDEERRDG